jgi:hypothetical protein
MPCSSLLVVEVECLVHLKEIFLVTRPHLIPIPVKRNCGKLGHWAKKCPEPKKDTKFSNKSNVSKTIPPVADGESPKKKVGHHNFYWCSKCNYQSATHDIDSHAGSKN